MEPTTPPPAPAAPEDDAFRALDPRVRVLWVLGGLIGALFAGAFLFGALTVGAGFLRHPGRPAPPLPPPSAAVVLALLLAANALVFPWLRFRTWRYGLRPHDLLLCYGVLWRVRRSIPRSRIQHVDVASGPIERAFGLATLTVYTAGTGSADARVPGLATADAEALRETLLSPGGPDA